MATQPATTYKQANKQASKQTQGYYRYHLYDDVTVTLITVTATASASI